MLIYANDPSEARQELLEEAKCWQANAVSHYDMAMFHKEQYLIGFEPDLARYRSEMRWACSFYRQARVILFALI